MVAHPERRKARTFRKSCGPQDPRRAREPPEARVRLAREPPEARVRLARVRLARVRLARVRRLAGLELGRHVRVTSQG
jgi:hypothetical protein